MFLCGNIVNMALKNLESLNSTEFKVFLDSFDNVLCDCDGVLWLINQPIVGIKETISKLKQCGKNVRFVTNNSTVGIERYQKKFENLQYDAKAEDVAYPSLAIIDYLKSINYQKEVYLLSTPIMRKEFQDAGFKLAENPDQAIESHDHLKELLKDNEKIGAVVIDVDLNLSYGKLLKASAYLRRPDVLFITAATDLMYPIGPNASFIGPGYFQDVLASVSNRTPVGFGKPGLDFNKYISKIFNIQDPSRTLFVGDSLEQDIGFGNKCGYKTLLVLTGITTLEQVTKATNKYTTPDYYMSSLGELEKLIKDKLNI